MDTAPGSEPLAKKPGHPRAAEAARAGPCDPQDPPPRIPDDTPPDERPAPRPDAPADAAPRSGTAAATPGAHEVTIDPDIAPGIAHGPAAHDASPRAAAWPGPPGKDAADGGATGAVPGP